MKINIVAVNNFPVCGREYWKEEDRVYVDDVYVAYEEKHAEMLAKASGQPHFLHIDMFSANPNRYLVEMPTWVAKYLFRNGKIKNYFFIRDENVPKCFTILTVDEVNQLGITADERRPVYAEYVKV